ncbi:MAG TPA: hypothetical protein VGX78_13600, partial [Pirellulales bacterium]|nr:hypothetical protein [Pirellulales bacterium]
MRPYVILDQPGEAYLDPEKKPRTTWYEKIEYRQWKLFARAAAGVDLSGRLVLPRPAYDGMQAIRFTLPASQASKSDR